MYIYLSIYIYILTPLSCGVFVSQLANGSTIEEYDLFLIYIYINTHTHTYIYIYIYIHIHIYIYMYIYVLDGSPLFRVVFFCFVVSQRLQHRGVRPPPELGWTRSIYISMYLYVCISIYSIYLSIYLSINLSIYLNVCIFIYLSIYLSM